MKRAKSAMRNGPLAQLRPSLRPNISAVTSPTKLFAKAATAMAGSISLAVKKKGFAVIALAGGRSAQGLCEHLSRRKISWESVHVFVIDERLVPITDAQSNFKLINDALIRHINIPRSNVHPFVHDAESVDEGALRYARELAGVGGMFDAIFVSAGEDGHIAGLYPHHYLLEEQDFFFAAFHDSPKPPADRMTALPRNFAAAANVILLVMGEAKRGALAKLKNTRLTFKDCPAKLVTRAHAHLILTDLKA